MSNYIVQADLLAQLSNAQLVQLTDDGESGSIDADKVSASIADAEAEVDSYVGVKYSTPITAPVPALVKDLTRDIAVYKLWKRRQKVPELVRTAYEDALKKLEGIAKGLITIGVDPPPAESSRATAGETSGPDRVFDRDKLGSF